ncbi:MAG TPA: GH25 family lysozyme [Kofleriaceae bacterium]|nr:GH25 family lysozyme [Kofleriaceae bacterium]
MRFGVAIAVALVAMTAYVVMQATQNRDPAVKKKPTPPECKLGPTTAGIDVSYYQGDITWSRVKRAGVQFAFIRVSDGATIVDTKFEANWTGAKRAHVLRGAYQFFRPNESPIEQANLLVRTLRARGAGELPPVIDIEVTDGVPLATVVANARVWIEQVRSQLGVEPIVYTNYGMFRWGGAEPLARQLLWLAHYTEACPSIPPPWQRWTFWQYTENGRVDGIDGAVDLDVFDGTSDELRRRFGL